MAKERLKELEENLKLFLKLIREFPEIHNEKADHFINKHIEQNVGMINEVISISSDHAKMLQNLKSVDDMLSIHVKFANEISKKLSLSTQRFLNASLGNVADYNEWLKAHCDLATD